MKGQFSRRHVVITGAVIVAVTAFAASADTLAGLGTSIGWKGKLSWSLPVAVDVLALVALVAWFTPGVERLGRWMTAGSVVTSVVLNALGHLVATGHLSVGAKMVIGVSAVPVISMALAAHLAVEVTRPEDDHPAVAAEVTTTAVPVVTPDDHPPVTFPAFEGDHLVTAEVTTPAPEVVTEDDRQEVTEVTAPVTAVAAEDDRRMVTETVTTAPAEVTGEVTTAIRRKAEKLVTSQDGKVTIGQLQDLGLSRRTATALRRELVAA